MSRPARKKRKRPPKPLDGWTQYTVFEQCPDCGLRDALDITGRPSKDHDPYNKKLRKRGLGWKITGSPRVVDDCEVCSGTGRVRRSRKGDPMEKPR